MGGTHTAIYKVENSLQVLSCKLNFVNEQTLRVIANIRLAINKRSSVFVHIFKHQHKAISCYAQVGSGLSRKLI